MSIQNEESNTRLQLGVCALIVDDLQPRVERLKLAEPRLTDGALTNLDAPN